ncbi:PREDICTED: gamma-glutamyl hydrolase A-like [Papilio xuthus]|uniref:folate gamma-glutamyl hydrolase n=1 Tax=Papilio xuthus TaxID=66420 RepID=A0AAJ6ZG73_PAPXU|nr:PREDICTED: gamma-glutamyl hydrolase A-like [Papilio xuthus]
MKVAYKNEILKNIIICIANDSANLLILWCFNGSFIEFVKMVVVPNLMELFAAKGVLLLLLTLTTGYILKCDGAVIVRLDEETSINERPIIGVLSQEQSFYLHGKYPEENYTSYIAASYVKDIEASGARVVPILIGKDRQYYRDIMSKLNGVLFPGGATYFNQSDGYADAGQHIYEIAIELNDAGDYFPIFGTCLGFELFIIIASGRGEKENRIRCYSYNNLPLHFTEDYRSSKMFKQAPEDIVDILANEDVTVNAHQFCIVDKNMESHDLVKDWRVSSYSDDDYGVKFIATIEHRRYPFYGVQFHPEKNSFEWKLSKNYAHSMNAIKANRYFMDFFVSECRRNLHSFATANEENKYVIYNYEPHFTGILGSMYHQCYFFEPRGNMTTK